MEEELNIENILGIDEIHQLFQDDVVQVASPEEKEEVSKEEKDDTVITEGLTGSDLFDDPESVGDDKDNKDGLSTSTESEGASQIYSSIAQALKLEGTFSHLEDNDLDGDITPEKFKDIIDKEVNGRFDEAQRRINNALGIGIEPSEVQKYESTLRYLDSISEDALRDESDDGVNLRKQLIYQDALNRGYSKERAEREVKRSFDSENDIEDAIDALSGNVEYFKNRYDQLIADAKAEKERVDAENKRQADELTKSVLNNDKIFGDFSIDKDTRKKVLELINKPSHRMKDGSYLTEIQKYQHDNPIDFIKNVGYIYALTNGFKSLDGLTKKEINKVKKSSLRDLQDKINGTSRHSDGSFKYVSGVKDSDSYSGVDWRIDLS